MTYQGYMALANDEGETIELVNAARVKAYTDNLAPTIGLRGCDDCEGLDEALGETYTNPTADFAPWYDPTDPDTANFYGVYPLAFEGIDDSTRTIESAELTGDGSVVVNSRFTGQDIRVSGMAFAADEAALNSGVSWLNNALNGTEEGRCFGDRLNLYSSCPPIEVLPPNFSEPYELGMGTVVETNVVNDPRATQAARWAALGGVVATEAMITGAGDGPLLPDGTQATTYARYTITSTVAGNALFGYDMGSAMLPVVPAGTSIGMAIYVRSSLAAASISVRKDGLLNGAGAGSAQGGASSAIAANTWERRTGVIVNNADFNQIRVTAQFPAGSQTVGQVIEVTCAFFVINTGVVSDHFDGDTLDSVSFVYRWDSAPNNSVSQKFDAADIAAEAAQWTTTSGTVDGIGDGVDFNWVSGDPAKVACREITGLIPGEQYQLRLRLEAYGDYYVSLGPGCVERFENMLPDPRLTATVMDLSGATVVDTRPATGAPDGGSFFRRTVITSGGSVSMPLSDAGTSAIPVNTGWDYVFSWYAQKNPSGGPATRVDWRWYDSGGAVISTVSSSSTTPGATWGRVTRTMTAPVGAAYLQPRLVWTGTSLAGQVLDFAQAQLQVGTSASDYFDGGYPDARWSGVENDSASLFEENVDYETIFGWGTAHNPPTEPTVLDFIPRTDTIFLSIQPTDTEPATPTLDLLVVDASVIRVARPGVIAFGTGDDAVPPSDGWTHLAAATMAVTWTLGPRSVVTTARAPSGSALTYTTAHGPERTLFGLQPGSRYRLMIEFDAFWAATDVAPAAALPPVVAISNASGVVTTYTDDNPGTFQYFWVVEFTADATASTLAFHPAGNLALGSLGFVRWTFHEYMVEEILEPDTVPPQPGRLQERTMYQVKASQGPILTNVHTSPCGVMGQVSFSIRAGNPFKYRLPIFAGGLPSGVSQTVVDVPCENGLPQIVNFAYNPSVETNATDWTVGGTGTFSAARTASATARVGGFVWRGTATNSPGNRLNRLTTTYLTASVTSGPTLLPGDELTVSLYVRTTNVAWIGTYDWEVEVLLPGPTSVYYNGSQSVAAADTWYRIEQTLTLPSNVAPDAIIFTVSTPAAITQGGGFDMDGLMIQRGAVATDPFDETTTGVEWSGTANSSALLLTQVEEDISEDPDCPTPPAPPAPPEIDETCITAPTSYNRTVVSISEDTVPRNLTAYPVITLVAGSAPIRQARIRFWPNPDNLTIDDLDPCSYDGEIIVSYIAAGATMIIDGVLREATVSLPGFETQNANHVLYGPDGGPVDWPELSGGIPYLVTLELDSSAPYTDTLMTVDLVVRD